MSFLNKTKKIFGLAAVTLAVGTLVKKLTSQKSPDPKSPEKPEKISKEATKTSKNK